MTTKKLKVSVVGAGYVGLSLALLLTKRADVMLYDIDHDRLRKIAAGISPLKDHDIEAALASASDRPATTPDPALAYAGADFVIVATPTNYDAELNYFDTSAVETVIRQAFIHAPQATIVIKRRHQLRCQRVRSVRHRAIGTEVVKHDQLRRQSFQRVDVQ